MATEFTKEQVADITANPQQAVPFVDAESGKVYYVVDEEFLFDSVEQNPQSREQLKRLIDEGFASGEVSEEEAHHRMQATIDKYRQPNA